MSTDPSVVRVWMPGLLAAILCLFFWDMTPVMWLFALPFLLVLLFMVSLAEVHDEGQQVRVKMLWAARQVPKQKVLNIERAFLPEIGILRLRGYIFPWGNVYFVRSWSQRGDPESASCLKDPFVQAAAAISGFLAARAGDIPSFRIHSFNGHVLAGAAVLISLILFAFLRKKKTGLANAALFLGTYILGCVRM